MHRQAVEKGFSTAWPSPKREPEYRPCQWQNRAGAGSMRQRVFEQFICSNTTMPNCGQGVERTARRMRGERNNLHILENAAMHLRFISSRSKMDMRTRAGRKRRTRCLDQARPRAAVPPPCGFTNSDMLACEKWQLAGHNLHNYTRRRPSIFSHHTAAFPSRGAR